MIKTKPQTLIVDNKYCPGCGHGVINRLVAEVLEELGVRRFKVLQEGVVRIYEAPMAPEELSRALALQNVAIASFQKHADTLEDYYLRLTGEEN